MYEKITEIVLIEYTCIPMKPCVHFVTFKIKNKEYRQSMSVIKIYKTCIKLSYDPIPEHITNQYKKFTKKKKKCVIM